MLTTANFIARSLIWMAVIAIPAQGMQVSTCGCGEGNVASSANGGSSPCCHSAAPKSGGCCCIAEPATCCGDSTTSADAPCCSSDSSSCQCGINCQCGKVKAPTPTRPPVENTGPEKVSIDSLSVDSQVYFCPLHSDERHTSATPSAGVMAALDRCISLCRFTL